MNGETVTGIGLLILTILGIIGNHVGSRYLKNKGTAEAKTYADDLIKQLNDKVSKLDSEITQVKQDNARLGSELKQAQAERDAARQESHALQERNKALQTELGEERENVAKMSKSLEDQEQRLAVLEQAAGKNEASKEVAQEILKLVGEGFMTFIAELKTAAATAATPAAVATSATPTPEGTGA